MMQQVTRLGESPVIKAGPERYIVCFLLSLRQNQLECRLQPYLLERYITLVFRKKANLLHKSFLDDTYKRGKPWPLKLMLPKRSLGKVYLSSGTSHLFSINVR